MILYSSEVTVRGSQGESGPVVQAREDGVGVQRGCWVGVGRRGGQRVQGAEPGKGRWGSVEKVSPESWILPGQAKSWPGILGKSPAFSVPHFFVCAR